MVGGDRVAFMTLSSIFCHQHFLAGLVLSDLASSLEMKYKKLFFIIATLFKDKFWGLEDGGV